MFCTIVSENVPFLTIPERISHRIRAYSSPCLSVFPSHPSISLAIHGYISFYIQSVFLNALKIHYLSILKAFFSPSYSSVPFTIFLTAHERIPHRARAYFFPHPSVLPSHPSISLAINGHISFYPQSVFLNALKVHYLPILKASFSPSYSSVPFAIFLTAPEPYSPTTPEPYSPTTPEPYSPTTPECVSH